MKKATIGLLIVSIFLLSTSEKIESKQSANQRSTLNTAKPAVKRNIAKPLQRTMPSQSTITQQHIAEEDSHTVVVEERPVQKHEDISPSVDKKFEQEPDGTVVETVTTTEIKDDKIVTTTETWTWKDWAKAAAIGLGVAGAIGAGLYYQDEIGTRFNNMVNYFNPSTPVISDNNSTVTESETINVGQESTSPSSDENQDLTTTPPSDNNINQLSQDQNQASHKDVTSSQIEEQKQIEIAQEQKIQQQIALQAATQQTLEEAQTAKELALETAEQAQAIAKQKEEVLNQTNNKVVQLQEEIRNIATTNLNIQADQQIISAQQASTINRLQQQLADAQEQAQAAEQARQNAIKAEQQALQVAREANEQAAQAQEQLNNLVEENNKMGFGTKVALLGATGAAAYLGAKTPGGKILAEKIMTHPTTQKMMQHATNLGEQGASKVVSKSPYLQKIKDIRTQAGIENPSLQSQYPNLQAMKDSTTVSTDTASAIGNKKIKYVTNRNVNHFEEKYGVANKYNSKTLPRNPEQQMHYNMGLATFEATKKTKTNLQNSYNLMQKIRKEGFKGEDFFTSGSGYSHFG